MIMWIVIVTTFPKLINKAEYGLLEQFLYWVNLNKYYSEVFQIPLSYTVGVSALFSSLLVFLLCV